MAPSPYVFVKSICLLCMNMFARFDEIPVMTLQDIMETKGYRWTDGHENCNIMDRLLGMKKVNPPQSLCGGGGGGCIIKGSYVEARS